MSRGLKERQRVRLERFIGRSAELKVSIDVGRNEERRGAAQAKLSVAN